SDCGSTTSRNSTASLRRGAALDDPDEVAVVQEACTLLDDAVTGVDAAQDLDLSLTAAARVDDARRNRRGVRADLPLEREDDAAAVADDDARRRHDERRRRRELYRAGRIHARARGAAGLEIDVHDAEPRAVRHRGRDVAHGAVGLAAVGELELDVRSGGDAAELLRGELAAPLEAL